MERRAKSVRPEVRPHVYRRPITSTCFIFSRQFGFLKLTHPDHAKKKAVVLKVFAATIDLRSILQYNYLQAIKYLERMLIQAQNQKERSNSNNKPNIKQEDIKDLDEDAKPIEESSNKSGTTIIDGSNNNLIQMEQDDSDDNDGDCINDINIDPKTYCKLGHFHLLLEDYPKGKRF